MIVAPFLRWNLDLFLRQALKMLVAVSAAWSLCVLTLFVVRPWNKVDSKGKTENALGLDKARAGVRFAYEAIGSGPLSLNPANQAAFLNLDHEIVILAKNARPDAPLSRAGKILVGLKSSGEEREVTSGSLIYLRYDPAATGAVFRFSSEPDALWIKPVIMEQSGVLIELGREVTVQGSVEQETSNFVLPEPSASDVMGGRALGRRSAGKEIEALKLTSVWGRDVLFEKYGGKEFQLMKEKIKLEFANPSQVCFVSQGDYLTLWEGLWRVVALQEAHPDSPLLYVKTISANGAEIQAWDATGFYPFQLKLDIQRPPKLAPRPEGLPSSLRVRTISQVTCLLGKRRLILKRGDWLLKTATGWRNIKRPQDIEDCLYHRLKGELFVFDAIEKEGGKMVLKGNLFDEMRTQAYPVVIAIENEKKAPRKGRPRKLPFSSTLPKQPEKLAFGPRESPGDRRSGVWTNFGLRRTAATSSDLTSSSSIYCVY